MEVVSNPWIPARNGRYEIYGLRAASIQATR